MVYETAPHSIARTMAQQAGRAVEAGQRFARAKAEATREIRPERAAFFHGCAGGLRDAAAEARFGDVFLQKDLDLYCLSHFAAFGVTPEAREHLRAQDRLTGSLDGGLEIVAEGTFACRVDAVRARFGEARRAPAPGWRCCASRSSPSRACR